MTTPPLSDQQAPVKAGDRLTAANRDCLAKRKPGEPLFVILGRDPDGGNIVRLWAERRRDAGDPDHAEPVFAIADAMDAWAADPANAPESAPLASAYAAPATAAATPENGGEALHNGCEMPEVATVRYIEQLRADEGDAVTILCDNPEAETNVQRLSVVCNGYWTGFHDRRYSGESVLQCLSKAVTERETGLITNDGLMPGPAALVTQPPSATGEVGARDAWDRAFQDMKREIDATGITWGVADWDDIRDFLTLKVKPLSADNARMAEALAAREAEAWARGMREAANICGSLAETTYDGGDAFEAATGCEAAIVGELRKRSDEPWRTAELAGANL